MNVRLARLDDAEVVRELRLRALADAPDAFGSTHEAEVGLPAEEWSARIRRTITLVLEDGDRACGLVVGAPHREDRRSWFLSSMWVDPLVRRRGGGAMLVAALARAVQPEGASALRLHVMAENRGVRRFYEALGFCVSGYEKVREDDGRVEVEMVRSLGEDR